MLLRSEGRGGSLAHTIDARVRCRSERFLLALKRGLFPKLAGHGGHAQDKVKPPSDAAALAATNQRKDSPQQNQGSSRAQPGTAGEHWNSPEAENTRCRDCFAVRGCRRPYVSVAER